MTCAPADRSYRQGRAPSQARVRRVDLWVALTAWGALLVAMSTLLIASMVITPEALLDERAWFVPRCPTRALLGRECLTCGTTRAFAAIGHGRLREALRYNRGAPVGYAFVWACAGLGAVQTIQTLRQLRGARARRIE